MILTPSKAADIITSDNLGLAPQDCGLNSAYAQQGPIISNFGTASSFMSLPTASTFPEMLNSSVLAAFEGSSQLSSTTIRPSFASAAAKEQLPSTAAQFAAENAILNAAFMLFTPSSSQYSMRNMGGTGKAQFNLSTSIRPYSVLS